MAWPRDSELAASGGDDNTMLVWRAGTGTQVMEALRGHSKTVRCVCFGARRDLLVSGSSDKTINVWELGKVGEATLRHVLQVHIRDLYSIALYLDDRYLVSGGEDRKSMLCEVATGQLLRLHNTFDVLSVAWSCDGRLIASGILDTKVTPWEVNVQVHGHVCMHVYTYVDIYIYIYIYI